MTRAPASASRQLHMGAATACSSEMTRRPERGRDMEGSETELEEQLDDDRTESQLTMILATICGWCTARSASTVRSLPPLRGRVGEGRNEIQIVRAAPPSLS